MRSAALIIFGFLLSAAAPTPPPQRAACADDYLTVETLRGIILEIKPAPDPFKTADIHFSGPHPCEDVWIQVLKADAARCREGASIEATGVVTMDAEAGDNSWDMGPAKNDYMTLDDDFHCN
ncbi:MAG TPA: hypothetical protein VHT51_00850 [Micropepsaceae bacterium]|jgi:hypothetical protein|nr:hypothetical protein [Micropepsaceae bacterium]